MHVSMYTSLLPFHTIDIKFLLILVCMSPCISFYVLCPDLYGMLFLFE